MAAKSRPADQRTPDQRAAQEIADRHRRNLAAADWDAAMGTLAEYGQLVKDLGYDPLGDGV